MVLLLLAAAAAAVVQLGGSGSDSRRSFPVTDLVGEEDEEPVRRLCGWRLANKLNQVCKGVYNKPGSSTNLYYYYRDRRGGGGREPQFPRGDGALPPFSPHPVGGRLQLPILTEEEASRVLHTRERSKRGLSAECCRKVCSVSELVGYCY